MFVNLLSAVVCLGLSAIYHNFCYMNRHVCDKLATLDYAGICVLIMGSSYPPIFYPFACENMFGTRNFFLYCITISCSIAFVAMLTPAMTSSACRPARAIMFVGLGLSALIPFFYL